MTTFVLIPPAGNGPWYWHLLSEQLRARGHEVVAVELPYDDDTAGLATYADVATAAVGERAGTVIVAQSFGAYTGTLISERARVRLLILLTPMIPAPGETPGQWWDRTGHNRAHAERDGDPATIFFHELSPELVEELRSMPWTSRSGRSGIRGP